MSWDGVYSLSQALAVVFAGVALVSGFVVNKRQAMQLLEQREKTANAEKAVLGLRNLVLNPRFLTDEAKEKAGEILRNGPKGKLRISFVSGDMDSSFLAAQFQDLFQSNGWEIWGMAPDAHSNPPNPGTTIIFKADLRTDDMPEPVKTLRNALILGPPETGRFGWEMVGKDKDFPNEDSIIEMRVGRKN
jgi:hypothetical protein